MTIRGDMEARYWADLGREKIKEIVLHFFECLHDPNAWLRMQRELGLTDSDLRIWFECVDWCKEHFVTFPKDEVMPNNTVA